jgi:hypothetical protein
MTTVTEARRELAQLAERQAELQKIVDAAPKILLVNQGEFCIGNRLIYDEVIDEATATAYGDALDTLLRLRHQPGTEAADGNKLQWTLDTQGDGNGITIDNWTCIDGKLRFISPAFATEAAINAAIGVVGADRILRMFRTLHGVA